MRLIKSPQNSSKASSTQLDLVDFIDQLKREALVNKGKNTAPSLTPTTH